MNLNDIPSLENLLCFVHAAERLNFRHAAQQMSLSPAAFGQRIKQLEIQLKVPLFARTSRTVELTLEGHRLLESAREVVRLASLCVDAVHQSAAPVHLTLGTRFELGLSWVVPSLLAFQRESPQIKIDTYFGSGPDILERLRKKEVDAIITSAPQLHRSWTSEFLHTETYVFVGASSLLEERPFREPKDAAHHTLVDIDATLPLTRYLTSASGELSFGEIRLCGVGAAVLLLVQAGLGIAVLPEYMVQDALNEGTLCRILPNRNLFTDSFRLIFSKDSAFRSQLQMIAAFLRDRPLR